MTSDKKDTVTDLRGHCIRLYVVAAANQTYQSKVATYVRYICCCCCAVINLINNRRMFNVEIDDLAEKPYPRTRALRSPIIDARPWPELEANFMLHKILSFCIVL